MLTIIAQKLILKSDFPQIHAVFYHIRIFITYLCISIHTVLHFLFVFALNDAVNQDFEFELKLQKE